MNNFTLGLENKSFVTVINFNFNALCVYLENVKENCCTMKLSTLQCYK